jgi:transposase
MQHYLGVDLHKKQLVWSLIDEQGIELHRASVLCHPDQIITALSNVPVPLTSIMCAIEPTCGWRWVSKLFEEQGIEMHYANPLKVRLIAESTEKTDRKDAHTLANLLRTGYLPEAFRVRDDIYELRTLVRERSALVTARTAACNRLHGVATTYGLHTIPKQNPRSVAGKEYIEQSDHVVLKELHTLIDILSTRIAVYDKLLAQSVPRFPEAKYVMSIPGVGIITTMTIVAEVGDFTRFSSSKKITKYAGLVPKQRSSGERVRHGSITKTGSGLLRGVLVEAAMRVREKGAPELFGFVARVRVSAGKKRSRVALARKLLSLIWYMVTTHRMYDPAQVTCGAFTPVTRV